MKPKNQNTIAGWAAVLSALLYLVSIVGLNHYVAVGLEDMDAFAQNIHDKHIWMQLYGWPGIFATLLILPVVYLLSASNQKLGLLTKTALSVSLIGLAFIVVGYLFHLTFTYFHFPMYSSLDPMDRLAFASFIRATIGLQDLFWLAGDLFAFLGIACLLMMTLLDRSVPMWNALLGIIAGTAAAIGSFSFIPAFKTSSILAFLFMVGFICFAIWEISLGILLLRSKDKT